MSVSQPERILVVEDDLAILTGLREKLQLEGYAVSEAQDGEEALVALRGDLPDLVVLDIMLPGVDGLTVLRELRKRDRQLPVLILSARGSEAQKVEGLRAGADDYLAKPFGLKELMARIEALLRRSLGKGETHQLGTVTVDLDARAAERGGEIIPLSRKEWDLLTYLLRRRGAVLSRDQILEGVWGVLPESDARAVDYHILNLRRKLEADPRSPAFIVTRHGLGYQIVEA